MTLATLRYKTAILLEPCSFTFNLPWSWCASLKWPTNYKRCPIQRTFKIGGPFADPPKPCRIGDCRSRTPANLSLSAPINARCPQQ